MRLSSTPGIEQLAADLLLKLNGLHLQSELVSQQVRYTADGQVAPALPGPNGGVLLE